MSARETILASLERHAHGYVSKGQGIRVWWSYNPVTTAPQAPVWPPARED